MITIEWQAHAEQAERELDRLRDVIRVFLAAEDDYHRRRPNAVRAGLLRSAAVQDLICVLPAPPSSAGEYLERIASLCADDVMEGDER